MASRPPAVQADAGISSPGNQGFRPHPERQRPATPAKLRLLLMSCLAAGIGLVAGGIAWIL